MLPALPIALGALLAASEALGAPQDSSAFTGLSIPLQRRGGAVNARSGDELGAWAAAQRNGLIAKYGGASTGPSKRSQGTNLLVNQNADSSYYGTLAVGTPPTAFNVILDTGSSDLWLADSNCAVGCNSVPTFSAAASSSFVNTSRPFSITYGSGKAQGALGRDTVEMAGFSVAGQTFAVCDAVSAGLLNSPVSGLLGLAWQTIAASGARPFWQTLAANGAWDEPVMSFQLNRFVNNSRAKELEPGGQFTMGFLNRSLYDGEVEYTNIPDGQGTYWILPLTSLTINGDKVNLPSGSGARAAIDTGTTLVGGPSAQVAALFAQIPGSAAGTGQYEGYYTYPCNANTNVEMAFGGRSWSISPADFRLQAINDNQCLGAFFELETSGSAPAWIVGDTFLKNVYSVFRYNPPSVGFAQLSGLAASAATGAIPSATIGTAATAVSAGPSSGAVSALSEGTVWSAGALLISVLTSAWML